MSKRRRFTAEFKARVVLEDLSGVKDRAELCREHPLSPQVLARWREESLARAPEVFATEASRGDEQARIAELERTLGRLRWSGRKRSGWWTSPVSTGRVTSSIWRCSLTALQRALELHPAPEIHHSDQGATSAYTDPLQAVQIEIGMAEVGEAWWNGYAERLIRTIREETIDLSEYRDSHDAYRQLGRFLHDLYLQKRIHSSLGYLTPAESEAQWRQEHLLAFQAEPRIA